MTDTGPANAFDAEGRRTGPWEEDDPHGGTVRGDYVAGERHGLWRHFSAGGGLRSEGTYDRGRLSGEWTWYRASGALLQRGGFLDDETHGPWQRWTAAGTLIDEGEWDRGKKTGTWVHYDPDGTVKRTTVHRGRTGGR